MLVIWSFRISNYITNVNNSVCTGLGGRVWGVTATCDHIKAPRGLMSVLYSRGICYIVTLNQVQVKRG